VPCVREVEDSNPNDGPILHSVANGSPLL